MPDVFMQRLTKATRILSWTSADANIPSWVFIDGKKAAGPLGLGGTARTFSFQVNYTRTNSIEVVDAEIEPAPPVTVPSDLPVIKWKTAANAQSYQVLVDGSAVLIIKAVEQYQQSSQIRRRLSDGWHKIEVKALDRYGNATLSRSFWLEVFAPSAPATTIAITAGSGAGLFDLTVTP